MKMTCKEPQNGASSSSVYEISGEPAIVINGVPNVASSECSSSDCEIANYAELERNPGFGELLEGRGVRKLFGEQFYSGVVENFDRETGWYRVVYEDGDFEDLERNELEEILVPLDITVPLKQVVLKILKKNEKGVHKTARIQASRSGKHSGARTNRKTISGPKSSDN